MLVFGLKVALIGIGIVFAALIVLVFVIKGITKGAARREKNSVTSVKAVKKDERAPGAENQDKVTEDAELMAVIAAAVACLTQGTMQIKAITRRPGVSASAWSYAGRSETMKLRQP